MKLYNNFLNMKKETFVFLIFFVIWIWMIIWTFFGWWEQKIQNENNGFIEQLNNTWEIKYDTPNSTWFTSIKTDEIDIPEKQNFNTEYTEIKVMMPHYFYTSGRKNFAEDLYKDQKIYINFIFIDNLNSYRDQLSNPDFSEADLFLFPYDRKENTDTRPFSPENDIQLFFDDFIFPIISNKQTWFLPFSADPMIMYSSINLTQYNFSEISDLVYDRAPNIQLAFPIFFWITSEDYNNQWFSREYQDIVRYALIHYFNKNQDSHSLWIRINSNIMEGSNEFRNYNTKDLNLISNTITQPECKNFPSICFQIYNFVWIRFGFLSDKDIIQKYFPTKKENFDKISRTSMPFFSLESPVRIRWRWINKNLKDTNTINTVYKFLIKYMNEHNKYNLRSSTLSVFKKEWDSLTNNQYIWNRWYILDTWWDYINKLRSINSFRQLIEYQISAKDFLKTI